MSTIASTLLDFILDLLRDPQKAEAYAADPEGELAAAGLHDTSPEEVADLMPMVTDMSTVTGWGDRGGYGGGQRDDHDHGGHDRDDDEGGYHRGGHDRDRDCDDEHDHRPVPVHDDDSEEEEGHSGGGHSGGGHSGGGGHSAPVPAGGTETVVITHLQEVHYTHNETTVVEIDASHSIWVSGDAQAIFGDVRGDVTQIDNEGGIVAGDDVEDSSIDNSDNSVHDSYNTDVAVDIENSPINVGGNQAVDSFNQDNDGLDVDRAEDSFNGNGSNNEDNDVIADRGGQVGDNTDNSVTGSFNGNDLSQDNDGIDDSFNGNDLSKENVGNDYSDNSETDNSVNGSFNGNDLSDDDGVDDSFNGSLNGNDLSDDDVASDNQVAIGGDDANAGYQEESQTEDNSVDSTFEQENTTEIEADDGATVIAG